MRRICHKLTFLSVCLAGLSAAVGAEGPKTAVTSSYIAPISIGLYRFWQPDGVMRELDVVSSSKLKGAFGWSGKIEGDKITLQSGSDIEPGGQGTYVFERGRLASFSGKRHTLRFNWRGKAILGSMQSLWPQEAEDTRDFWKDVGPWRKSKRLKLWFNNPNRAGTLFAELGIVLLALLAVRRRAVRIVCGLGLVATAALIYLSGSRGAFVAFLVAAAALGSCGIWTFIRERRRFAVWIGVAFLSVALAFVGSMQAGLWGRRARGDTLRTDILAAVPQMMCDAPQGWGFIGAGKAYRDWYQRLDDPWVTWSLVSDHLTTLVNAGWPVRFAYVFGWLALVALLGLSARKMRSARVALAIWLVMGVSSAFNRIYLGAVSLWLLPLAALAWWAWCLPRKRPGARTWLALGGAAVVSGVLLGLCALLTDGSGRDVRVRADGKRVLVNSRRPSVWVVDDGWVLGGGLVGKELHAAYAADRARSGIGYVSSVFDLPSAGIGRLVLAGKAGWEFLLGLSEGKFPGDFDVPAEIVFLSPPFPPSAIPELLLKNANVRLVIGEFATVFFPEYRTPPPWVTIVSGCELYLPDWIDRCLIGL